VWAAGGEVGLVRRHLPTRSIASDTFLAGTLRKAGAEVRREEDGGGSRWVFWQMTAGRAFPLSVDHYYFP
jgi:hypothetical protein